MPGATKSVPLLPGAVPPGAPGPGPARTRAICCSGGGIRAAAFALGGLQKLNEPGTGTDPGRSWYSEADFITSVSGGGYIAGSYAMVNHKLEERRRSDNPPDWATAPAYAPGSAEDNLLRAHTRYLADDRTAISVGLLGLVYGLLLNLAPMLAGLYVAAKVLGSLLSSRGMDALRLDDGTWQVSVPNWVVVTVLVLVATGVALFTAEKLSDVYFRPKEVRTRWLTRASLAGLGSALLVALLFMVVPFLLHLLSGVTSTSDVHVGATTQTATFVGTVAATVGLVRGHIGAFKTVADAGQGPKSAVGRVMSGIGTKVLRRVVPWLGSALVLVLLVAAFLTWTSNAATGDHWTQQWWICGACLVGIVVVKAVTDVNRNSLHPYYRSRLASAFAVERTSATTAAAQDYSRPIRFSSYAGDSGPALVVCATVNTDERHVVPSGRNCAPFTFSSSWTGISAGTMFTGDGAGNPEHTAVPEHAGDPHYKHGPRTHPGDSNLRQWRTDNQAVLDDRPLMLPTREYEERAGQRLMTLPAAVAVSGAAVSPQMGRMSRPSSRLLLSLTNVRLGLWLPNPLDARLEERQWPPHANENLLSRCIKLVRWQAHQPGICALLKETFGGTTLRSRWIYVTDGGHYENLGLVEALRRGATEIISFDASGDQPGGWSTLGQAIETARADLGVEITIDPATQLSAQPGQPYAPTMMAHGEFVYPDGVGGTLLYCKLAMAAGVSWDVQAWAKQHDNFPNDSTLYQLYSDREFEAYRRLGHHAAGCALTGLSSSPAVSSSGVSSVLPRRHRAVKSGVKVDERPMKSSR
ncbi:MAG: hypothetical protein ABJA87_09485 [bacterium]